MLPMVDALAENRLPHLLGARRTHRPLVFVKFETAVLERQTAIIKKTSHLGLGVVDHVFIENSMHPARQYRIDVSHQVHIIAIVPADVLETVGETLPTREMLFES